MNLAIEIFLIVAFIAYITVMSLWMTEVRKCIDAINRRMDLQQEISRLLANGLYGDAEALNERES